MGLLWGGSARARVFAAACALSAMAMGCGDDSGKGGSSAGGAAPEGGSGQGGQGGAPEGGGPEGGAGGGASTGTTFVLVHGAFAGAWSWDRVTPALEAGGATVVTVELPAHGADETPTEDATLAAYTDAVVAALDAAPGQVVLVGHSMGGLVISQAAEARPDAVSKLVYLAAFMLEDGKSLIAASANDPESNLAMYLTQGTGTLTLQEEGVLGAFCSDCSDEDAALVISHLKPEPSAPFFTAVHVTEESWGSVPRAYIETLADQTIGPTKQASFIAALPVDETLTIDSGHCPFLTKPNELAAALLSLAP